MRNKLLSFGLAGLTSTLLSFTFIQDSGEVQEPKKERHIKMTKIENGKKMVLDTVLTGDDVFIWNGDTINPARHIKKFSPSGFDKMHNFDVTVERKDGKEKVMIFRQHEGKPGSPMMWHGDFDADMEIVTEDIDSLGKRIVMRKIMKDGKGNHMMFLNDGGVKHFPPVPPVPPVPHVKMMKMQHSGRVIDLNDPNIISYKKKDMSGDREKIEIIRKKKEGSEHTSFDFEFDHEMGMPEAPEAGEPGRKMIRKEIKVETDSKENK
jgi:hypothetical protein